MIPLRRVLNVHGPLIALEGVDGMYPEHVGAYLERVLPVDSKSAG